MEYPLWLKVLLCFLALLTAVANGLVIFVIIRRPQLHLLHANWFVLSLSVADFCVGLTSIPYAFLCELDSFSCYHKAVLCVYWFFLIASVTNLCCMVADRYISVVWSLRYRDLITTKRVAVLISTAWAIPLVIILIALPIEESLSGGWKVYIVIYLFIMAISPSVFLLLATGHMIYTARKLSRQRMVIVAQLNFNRPEESTAVITVNREARIKSSTIIVSAVVGCFVLCYSVGTYIEVCGSFSLCNPPHIFNFLSALLYTINSLLNPIAYSFFKCDIKTELRRLFCHCTPQVSP